jgi:SAM-dependent methyltransferase
MQPSDFSPAADRNKQHILEVLAQILPAHGKALEIASGTGQHVMWFAAALPGWTWQPSDAKRAALESTAAAVAQQTHGNVQMPLRLDVLTPFWLETTERFDLIYCANLLHIAPWQTCAALMLGSQRHLAPGGRLVTYGPYFENEVATSEGNLAFDRSLREQNPDWGIRQLGEVRAEATRAGLKLAARNDMPANNLLLVWTQG